MKYKTIIFDLDGTLIHSAPDLQAAINHALQSIGRPGLELSTVISFIGNGVEKLVERGLNATGGTNEALHAEALARFMAYYEQNMTTLTQPYPGVVSVLEGLQAKGLSLGVCTNKPTQPAIAICDALNLSRFFEVVAGAEAGKPKKPDAAPLLDCIKRMVGDIETTLYVGDSAVDYETAVNAGVDFRLFSEGYLNESLPALPQAARFDDWSRNGILSS